MSIIEELKSMSRRQKIGLILIVPSILYLPKAVAWLLVTFG